MTARRVRKGAALLMSMIVLAALSVWAVSICSFSGTNLQLAENQRKADAARVCAESGLEVMRYWLSRVSIPGTINKSEAIGYIASSLQNELSADGIYNIVPYSQSSSIIIPSVTLDSAEGKSFFAQLTQLDADTVRLDVTGNYGSLSKRIRVKYLLGDRAHTAFDYGVATRGPLSLAGNIQLEGVNISVESDVYIESLNSILALSITGNSQIAGDVKIANPLATERRG